MAEMRVWETVLVEIRSARQDLNRLTAAIEKLAGASAAGAAPGQPGAPATTTPPADAPGQ